MQIVIDIPEELYDEIKHYGNISVIHKAVLDGTPLPKGHGRLIDADAEDLQSELWTFTRYTGIDEAPYENACLVLDKAPTILEADGGDE